MNTAYVSGRVPPRYERLVVKQARAAKTSKSDLVARYVIEKSLENEFPGISFRDSLSGREALETTWPRAVSRARLQQFSNRCSEHVFDFRRDV